MPAKPTIIYVSGAPGAGKSTLAKALSEQLYVPHVSSDLVHGGIALTDPNHDRLETLHNVFVPAMIDLAKRGISFTADHVLQKGISETDIIEKLRPHANIIYVHVESKDPLERYVKRVRTSTLPSVVERREHLLGLVPAHTRNLPKTAQPLDLGVPVLTVNTDDGYSPPLEDVVAFIRARL